MPLIYGEGLKAFHRLQEEILKLQEDYSILAWGNGVTSGDAIPEDIQCEALSSSPSTFGCDLCQNTQWNLESSMASSKGDQRLSPPISMTSRGLFISVQLVSHTFGGRTFCLAILGYGPSGQMLCIPLREVGSGRVFARLCVLGDWGGFIYMDETDTVRKLPYTSIYIGRPDHYDVPDETLWKSSTLLTVHTTGMNDCLIWMEPLPVLYDQRCKKRAMRPNSGRVILTGREMTFTGKCIVPSQFLLRLDCYKNFIVSCMTISGAIFFIILQPYGSYIIHYNNKTHPNEEDSQTDCLHEAAEEVYKEVESMRGIHSSKALVNYTFDGFHLRIRYSSNLARGFDVTISTKSY